LFGAWEGTWVLNLLVLRPSPTDATPRPDSAAAAGDPMGNPTDRLVRAIGYRSNLLSLRPEKRDRTFKAAADTHGGDLAC
jgi:hypothetical protein